ncbi:2-C-methyl-D-erythritol 2,4-cyclodiphosphate synthase [Mycoplasmatota bacterium]|nr:2-C-methyl-D-erythritol 2,4-cyclodiphosphate synthase [Mycoplasmatota bacterium]
MPMRIGHSVDVHQFDPDKQLILGGVKISFKGLRGHSDADVLLHVVAESILGALALGDLGNLFPDTDSQYKDKESKFFVTEALKLCKSHGYLINNIDCMILAEKPKLINYIHDIRKNIANLLEVNISQVSVKATTTEKLGFIGKGEGIMATATVLIKEGSNEK